MTPRSVQIWFQNRRQRLLKPDGGLVAGEHSPQSVAALAAAAEYNEGMSEEGSPCVGPIDPSIAQQMGMSSTGVPLPPLHPSPTPADRQQHQLPLQAQQHQQMGGAASNAYPVTAAHFVHAFAPLLRAEQHRAEQQQYQQEQQQRQQQQQQQFQQYPQQSQQHHPWTEHAPPHTEALPPSHTVDRPMRLATDVRIPSEDPSIPESLHSSMHFGGGPLAAAAAAAHAAHGGASDEAPSAAPDSGAGAAAALPLLMSRLGGLMAMGAAASGASDPTQAISQALAMLPQAVAAGHVSPGAAALLMQALQQQVSAVVGGGWAPPAGAAGLAFNQVLSSSHLPNPSHVGHHLPPMTPSPSHSSAVPSPNAHQPLPAHLGGPAETGWRQTSVAAEAADTARRPAPTAVPPLAQHPQGVVLYSAASTSAQQPSHQQHEPPPPLQAERPSEPRSPPCARAEAASSASPSDSGVDGLLLLSACADVQRLPPLPHHEPLPPNTHGPPAPLSETDSSGHSSITTETQRSNSDPDLSVEGTDGRGSRPAPPAHATEARAQALVMLQDQATGQAAAGQAAADQATA